MRRILASFLFLVAFLSASIAQIMPPSVPPTLTAEAPYLLFDNFPGTPTALNGKAPVIGNGAGTYQVTGANLANAMSGNGNAMLNVANGNAYVQYQLASAPGEIGFTFEFAQSNATGARPTTANSTSLVNPATSSFVHPQISLTQFSPDFFVSGTPTTPSWFDNNVYSTLSINTVYTARIFIEAPYLHMYLFDPSGAQVGYLATYDPGFAAAIGGGTFVFYQLFDGATNLVPFGVTYHSWWARAKQKQTVSNSYLQGGIDQTPIGLRTPAPARFTSLNVGNGNPGGKFAVGYNSSTDAIPTISDANPGADSTIKLRSSGGSGGAKVQVANAANNTHMFGVLNDATGYLQDYNTVNWLVRPPYDGTNEFSRYPYTTAGIRIGGSAGPYWYSGAGAPTIDAPVGSFYSNTSGGATTTTYTKYAVGAANWLPLGAPTGPAGGGLTGTYPNPTVAALPADVLVGTDSHISRDGAVGVFSFGTGNMTRDGTLEANFFDINNGVNGLYGASGISFARTNSPGIGWVASNATLARDTQFSSPAVGVVSADTGTLGNSLAIVKMGGAQFVGTAPTAAAGAGAGTTPPAPVVTAGANSPRGNITFGTGTVPAAGAQVVVTFAAALSSAPAVIMLQATNAASTSLSLYPSAVTTTGFTVSSTSAPAASQVNTTYTFNYLVVQ